MFRGFYLNRAFLPETEKGVGPFAEHGFNLRRYQPPHHQVSTKLPRPFEVKAINDDGFARNFGKFVNMYKPGERAVDQHFAKTMGRIVNMMLEAKNHRDTFAHHLLDPRFRTHANLGRVLKHLQMRPSAM